MSRRKCDWCGSTEDVKATHYGTTFGYVRLMCINCAKSIEKETGSKVVFLDKRRMNDSEK